MYYARTYVYFHIYTQSPSNTTLNTIPYIHMCTHTWLLPGKEKRERSSPIPIKTHQRKTTKPHHHHHQLTLTCILSELRRVLSILFRVLPNKCKSITRNATKLYVYIHIYFCGSEKICRFLHGFDLRRLKTGYGESLLCDLWYLTGRNKTSECCGRIGRWMLCEGACRPRKKINWWM